MHSPAPTRHRPRLSSSIEAVRRLLVLGLVVAVSVVSGGADADEMPSGTGEWPLGPRPVVVAGFESPATPYSAGHRGVDLAGGPAQSVQAALAGRVSFAGRIAGRGVVVVDHGGFRTTYEPVAAIVEVGDLVRAGSRIGHLELFGSHCFPAWCLHWGLIEGRDQYLDPLTLVGAAPVVLLPLHTGSFLTRAVIGPVQAPPLQPPNLYGPGLTPPAFHAPLVDPQARG